MKKCFVISPIGEEGSEVRKKADKVFKYIISPVCEICEFEPIRVDKVNQVDSINQTIIDHVLNSELVIADITGHNPNAFYEMGYRKSTGRPMIHLREKGEKIPFDIVDIRTFEYDLSDLDSVEEIKTRLITTIRTLNLDKYTEEQEKTLEFKSDNTQLIQTLYAIQDEITKLREEIHHKDTETIQAIVKASTPMMPVEDANVSIMKAILPELLKNPSSMNALLELGEMANKGK